jgi:predicted regulator of Ras-like GTPase activity (Roadblock/LC7/MglB family)
MSAGDESKERITELQDDVSAGDESKERITELRDDIRDLKNREGIIGYILRGSNSATIDLRDSTKIIEYALLSATAFEKGREISGVFEIGEMNMIVLGSEDKKVLLTTVGDDRLSIFMEKNVDHKKLCEDLNLL